MLRAVCCECLGAGTVVITTEPSGYKICDSRVELSTEPIASLGGGKKTVFSFVWSPMELKKARRVLNKGSFEAVVRKCSAH